jgi:hypothetical protein
MSFKGEGGWELAPPEPDFLVFDCLLHMIFNNIKKKCNLN